MPFLIKLIHGRQDGLQKLMHLFRKRWTLKVNKDDKQVCEENWECHCPVSKRQVEKKITSIASKELRSALPKARWYVHSNILELYKLDDIPLPTNGLVFGKSEETSVSPLPLKPRSPSPRVLHEVRTQEKYGEVVSIHTTPPVKLDK